jgi:hypothetical protein
MIQFLVDSGTDLSLEPSDEWVECMNALATLSALVRNPETNAFELVSRLTFYEGDEPVWPFYVSLAARAIGHWQRS